MMLSGRVIGAAEALANGLVHRVVVASPFDEAVALARLLAANSPKAVALTKQLVLADRRTRIQKFAAEVDRARIAVTESDEYRDVVQQKPGAGRART
jgi:enoyl-CoA hydratase/carnithine racemase